MRLEHIEEHLAASLATHLAPTGKEEENNQLRATVSHIEAVMHDLVARVSKQEEKVVTLKEELHGERKFRQDVETQMEGMDE